MKLAAAWVAVGLTVAVLLTYELLLSAIQRRQPQALARSAHASLRLDWFEAVSAQKGSEILAVQTLRNSLMSATMLASTAALGLMGTVTLAAPSLHTAFGETLPGASWLGPKLVLEVVLLSLLITSLVSAVMSVRFYSHASFIAAIPTEAPVRRRWERAGAAYVRKAGVLYSVSLRHLVFVVPVVAAQLSPFAGPVAAFALVAVLLSFDRFAVGPTSEH
ncbi:MAG: DUF599 domain-containing protein [Paucibacter sp.]|nr:DUF599 domain-containing protein [Roseateles sp.]